MGSFIARWKLLEQGKTWDWTIFALALLVTLLYQVLSNFANDYGDGVKGTDQNRIGEAEQRAVASGKISAKQMRNAMFLFAFLSFSCDFSSVVQSIFPDFINEFYTFVGLGVACILAAIGYTVGKKPYGYLGFGRSNGFYIFWVGFCVRKSFSIH